MIYDLMILGTGPACLFAAMELAKNTDLKILILEKARRLNDSRNVSLGWLGGSARAAVNMFLEPGFGGEITDPEVFNTFEERLKTYSSIKYKPSKPKLLKKTLLRMEEENIEVKEPSTIFFSEDKMIKMGDMFYKELKLKTTVIHKIKATKFYKEEDVFHIETNNGNFQAKKCILGLGRAGGQWLEEINSEMVPNFEESQFELGLRLEFPIQSLKECLSKTSFFQLKFGDFKTTIPSVGGTVETEELGRLRVSNGRLINSHKGYYANMGLLKTFKTDDAEKKLLRLVEIANVLSDNQLLKEPVSRLLTGKSVLSPIPEYDSMKEGVAKILQAFPTLKRRCSLYAPEARLNTVKYSLSPDWETNIEGMFIIGDMSGKTKSFVQAACSGLQVAKKIEGK